MSPTPTLTSPDSPEPKLTHQEPTSAGGSTLALPDHSKELEKGGSTEIPADGVAEALPKGAQLYLIMLGLFLTVFLSALDQTIVAPAIPKISNEFKSTADVTWYISAYFATSTALQPLYGRFYRINLKYTFLTSVCIFELGSLICALANSSKMFIVGRAIAGVGIAGGYLGVMTIIAASVPLDQKAFWAGNVGAAYGLGAVIGPLIGGAFTSKATWRWCFWINLPIGGLTVATIVLFFKPPSRTANDGKTMIQRLREIDWLGTAMILGAMICILLALQTGGLTKEWSDSQVWGLILGFGLLNIAFAAWQFYRQDSGIIPPRLIKQRTIMFASITNFCIGAGYFSVLSFLPIYFQIRGSSAIRSGVQSLPLICGVIVSVVFSGAMMPKVGYTVPFLLFGMGVFAIGSGVVTTFDATTSQAMWGGITFLVGVGSGAAFQAPFISAQTVSSFPSMLDMEQAASLTLFFQLYGGAIVFSVSQSIFANKFAQGVLLIPGLANPEAVAAAGETAFRSIVSPDLIPAVEAVAIHAVQKAFIPPVAFIVLGFFTSLGIEWNSLKNIEISSAA